MPVNGASLAPALRAVLLALGAAIALWCLLAPQPALANVQCSPTPNPETLPFGGARTASPDVGYSCKNNDATSHTFFLCAGMGNPNPGNAAQPQLQNGTGGLINYNVYRDAAFTDVWTTTKPIIKSVTIGAGQTLTGSFPYYARISTASPPTGSYTGYLFNTVLGFATSGTATSCQLNLTTGAPSFVLNSQDVTVAVTANVVPSCTLGTISPVNFGTAGNLRNRIDATGSVQLSCPTSLPWTLRLGGGNNASGTVRRMKNPAGNFVPYSIYRDSGRTTLIAVDGTITGTGNGVTQTTTIYGRVDPAAPPALGLYQDTIVVTLSF